MHRALRPQDEVARRVVRNHHNANLKNLRQTEEDFKQRQADRQPRPSFKLKRFRQVSSRVHESSVSDVRSISRLQTTQDHVPKRKLGHLPPYLRKMRAEKEQQRKLDEQASEPAPAGFRLLTEEQRTEVLGTLQAQLISLEKELEKKFPSHKHVPRSQSQAQKDLLQQIEQIKATQKKFSVKKVWVEIDDDDGVVEDDCDEFAQFSDVDDLDELELENQLASFTVNDAAESGECIGDAIDIRADSPEIEGLDAIQMPHDLRVPQRAGNDQLQQRDNRQISSAGEDIVTHPGIIDAAVRADSSSPEIDGLDAMNMPQDLKAIRAAGTAASKMKNRVGSTPWATDVDLEQPRRQTTVGSRSPWATEADFNQHLARQPASSRMLDRPGGDPRFTSSIQFG